MKNLLKIRHKISFQECAPFHDISDGHGNGRGEGICCGIGCGDNYLISGNGSGFAVGSGSGKGDGSGDGSGYILRPHPVRMGIEEYPDHD